MGAISKVRGRARLIIAHSSLAYSESWGAIMLQQHLKGDNMKLTYWCARQDDDLTCYNIRTRTKKECLATIKASWQPHIYSAPFKMTIEYADSFSLLEQCLSESGVHEYSEKEKGSAQREYLALFPPERLKCQN